MAVVYSPEVAERICARLAEGESLKAICRDDGFPSDSNVRAWARDDVNGFSAQYARAREIGYAKLAEEILEISDTPVLGTKTVNKVNGVETTEGDMIEHRRLQVDSRKWMLSKMLPKIYGDRVALTGEGGKDLIPAIDPMEGARRVAFLLHQALEKKE